MKLKTTMTAMAVSLAFITGCEAETEPKAAPALPQQAPAENEVLVSVNDTDITAQMFGMYFQQWMRGKQNVQNTPQTQSQALNELINIVLLTQEADKQKLAENPEVAIALEVQRMKLLSSLTLNHYAKTNQPTEETLKAQYEEQLGKADADKEYHARHILVKTEEEAKDLIAQLNAGGDFEALAKEHSTGPTGKNGGDLGWFGGGQMVKPFSDAVASMEKGAVSENPVKTQFGWHIIKLEDSRAKEPPSFESIKDKMTAQEQRKLLSGYVKGLSEKANIVVNEKLRKPEDNQPESEAADKE